MYSDNKFCWDSKPKAFNWLKLEWCSSFTTFTVRGLLAGSYFPWMKGKGRNNSYTTEVMEKKQ